MRKIDKKIKLENLDQKKNCFVIILKRYFCLVYLNLDKGTSGPIIPIF